MSVLWDFGGIHVNMYLLTQGMGKQSQTGQPDFLHGHSSFKQSDGELENGAKTLRW